MYVFLSTVMFLSNESQGRVVPRTISEQGCTNTLIVNKINCKDVELGNQSQINHRNDPLFLSLVAFWCPWNHLHDIIDRYLVRRTFLSSNGSMSNITGWHLADSGLVMVDCVFRDDFFKQDRSWDDFGTTISGIYGTHQNFIGSRMSVLAKILFLYHFGSFW